MEKIWLVAAIGCAAGVVGTGLGGLLAMFVRLRRPGAMSVLLEFSAGVMTGVVCFDLLPEALELSGPWVVLPGILLGCALAMWIQDVIKYRKQPKNNRYRGLLGTGVITAVGIAAHNFPEGLAVGSGFAASTGLGLSLIAVILLHDVPEGMATAAPLMGGGVSKSRAVLLAALSGVPMGFGALLGIIAGGVSRGMVAFCLAVSAGTMLYISFGDLIPESKRLYSGRRAAVAGVFGILCGFVLGLLMG